MAERADSERKKKGSESNSTFHVYNCGQLNTREARCCCFFFQQMLNPMEESWCVGPYVVGQVKMVT